MTSVKVFNLSTAKVLFIIAGLVVFFWLGVRVIDSRPVLGWVSALLFGVGALAALVILISGRVSLRLDEQGIEQVGIFKRMRLPWKDIESINVAEVRHRGIRVGSVIAINFKLGDPRCSEIARSVVGMDTQIGNIYDVSMKELCTILQSWHKLYATSPNTSFSHALRPSRSPQAAIRE